MVCQIDNLIRELAELLVHTQEVVNGSLRSTIVASPVRKSARAHGQRPFSDVVAIPNADVDVTSKGVLVDGVVAQALQFRQPAKGLVVRLAKCCLDIGDHAVKNPREPFVP